MTRFARMLVMILATSTTAVAMPAGAAAVQATSAPRDTVRLDRVADLAAGGQTEEARSLLTRWWTESLDDASRQDVQRGLWLRGRLTVDPAQAELDFRRLVIQFPGGPYSDRALLRLAQAAHEMGDEDGARALVGQLERDYPGSSAGRQATTWLASAGPAPEPPPEVGAPPPARRATEDSGPMIQPEATSEPPAPPVIVEASTDSAGAAGPDAGTSPGDTSSVAAAPPEPLGDYAVQLGAFVSASRARTLATRASDAGFEPRLVRVEGSRLLHVRVGRFDTFEGAGDLLTDLKSAGFTAALVRDASHEQPVQR